MAKGQRPVGVDGATYSAGLRLQPHRMETFKLDRSELRGQGPRRRRPYVSPPARHRLCVDEKSQIQALDRSQPMMPMRPASQPEGAMTTKGMAPRRCSPPSILQPDGSSASPTDATVPPNSQVPPMRSRPPCRTSSTSISSWTTTPRTRPSLIRRWLAKRPRWHVHLTPTSSSWLNQVERFFALLTDKKIRRGVYRVSPPSGPTSLHSSNDTTPIPNHSDGTKSADDILASIERFCRYNALKTPMWCCELLVQDTSEIAT